MRIPKVFIALTILAMLLTTVIIVTSPIAVIPSMMPGFAPYGTTTIGAVPDLVVVLSALAFVGASMTFAMVVDSSTLRINYRATYRSQRSLSRGNLGQLFTQYLRAILLRVTATLSSFFQPTIYGYIPPVLYAPFGARKNSAAVGKGGRRAALVLAVLVGLIVAGYFVMSSIAIITPASADVTADNVVAIPEFSGLAIVAFSALAASLYLLRRKRR